MIVFIQVLDATSEPQGPQVLGQRMFAQMSLHMLNAAGIMMETVGYVNDPYTVRAEIFQDCLKSQAIAIPNYII